jgi:hypothetical protein
MNQVVNWLLEKENPEVRYRTLTELVEAEDGEKLSALEDLLSSDMLTTVMERFSLGKNGETYNALGALAEFGLTRRDVDIDSYVDKLIEETNFQMMCGEALLLRNLVLLGYKDHPRVAAELPVAMAKQKPDGGYGCMSKNLKINPAKGCYRQTNTYVLLAAALRRAGGNPPQVSALLGYYLDREVLFTHDDPEALVVPDLAGTFYPLDPVKIGLQMTLYSLAILGVADDPRCAKAWEALERRRNEDGRYILDKSLSKPLYKIGKPGKPNKWVTLYALLAGLKRDTRTR